ncbi:MAG: PDDEXK nuclease domain-containing protein [Elusimicrobiales bacterium]|nr:PDDEXK nuclease domain-containing protein [Elusimicrobiales bacterium]
MPGMPVKNYGALLAEIKSRVRAAQYTALRAVNRELVGLYWDIGRLIVERQKREAWGRSVVERLAADLRAEFPGVRGFSAQNLWYMRQVYGAYCGSANLQPLVGEIGWAKHILIISRCGEGQEREFYIRMTRKYGWTKAVLALNIEAGTYHKYLRNQTNFDAAVPDKVRQQAKLAVKDEYAFDFLELGEEHSERELESALMRKVGRFLAEMGGAFTFAGSQFRLEIEGQEYFIDILLYHRHLKCLVAVELKVGEFLPEYVGKMQFYLAALDDLVRRPDENPSIGILICKSKKRTIVEYSLRESRKPIGVSTYKLFKALPGELKTQLPSPEQVSLLLEEGLME